MGYARHRASGQGNTSDAQGAQPESEQHDRKDNRGSDSTRAEKKEKPGDAAGRQASRDGRGRSRRHAHAAHAAKLTPNDAPVFVLQAAATPRNALSAPARILFWAACFITPIIIFCATAAWSGVYPFGDKSFLVDDLKFQYIDFFEWWRGVLTGANSVSYSFAQAMGSNSWGLYSYYLASPLNFIILLFDPSDLTRAIFVIVAIKLGLIQVSTAAFLRRRFELSYGWTFLLAMCFACCGWVVTQLRNPMWLDALILLPLVALACRRLIRTGSWVPLALVMAADVMVCWYTAYMIILFACLFVLLELAAFRGEGGHVARRLVAGRAARFAASIAVALLLAAWTFLPTVMSMLSSDQTNMPFTVLLAGVRSLVRGVLPGMYALTVPEFYIGLVPLVIAAAMLANRRIPRIVRIAAAGVLAAVVAGAVFTMVEYVWSGFRVPGGFYSRITFLASFTGIWMAAANLRAGWALRRPRARDLAQRVSGLGQRGGKAALAVVVALTGVELTWNAHTSWDVLYKGPSQQAYSTYVADANAQMAELSAHDGSTFYRVDKTYVRAEPAAANEGLARGFDPLSSYASTSDRDAVAFLNCTGYSSQGEFSTRVPSSNLVMDSLLGLKYLSAASCPIGYVDDGLSATSSGMRFYRNPYALSLGYLANESVVGLSLSADENPFERQNDFVKAVTGSDEPLYTKLEAERSADGTGNPSWTVTVPAGTIGYTYVMEKKDPRRQTALSMQIDGGTPFTEASRFNHNVRTLNAPAASDTAHTVRIEPNKATNDALKAQGAEVTTTVPDTTTCVFYALNLDRFKQVVDQLREHEFTPEVFQDGHVEGVYDAPSDGTLLLTLPHDDGWDVTVNGAPATLETACGGGLSTIKVSAGENRIEMTYHDPGLLAGCVVTGITAAALVAGCAVARRRKR